MQDEARHVMFGRLALRDYYPQLTQAERDEREEFCVDACYRMRDRFLGEEVWERLGLPQGGHRVRRAQRADAAVPRLPVHAHRADPEGHRAVGAQDPERLRRHGRHRSSPTCDIDAEMANDEAAAEELDDLRMAHIREVAATADD